MSRWPQKYVIGLTGNIGVGKSVVRRMLEHLGAYGIDADAVSHRVIEKGAPGYAAVVETFGRYVLYPDGQVNRGRLGRIVFSDPEGMRLLEGIIHPLVSQVTDRLIQRVAQPVIVIEAIKLLEGNLGKDCDSIWVAHATPEVQLRRLVEKRGMPEADAAQRIAAQASQEEKIRQADVVIHNGGTLQETWQQVLLAWKRHVPVAGKPPDPEARVDAALRIEIGRLGNAAEVAAFLRKIGEQDHRLADDKAVMKPFEEKAILLLRRGPDLVGLAGWQVENLVSRTSDLFFASTIEKEQALAMLLEYIERSASGLQCEVSFVFTSPELAAAPMWQTMGYQAVRAEQMRVPAWVEAAQESQPENTIMFFKKLREDRVLKPV